MNEVIKNILTRRSIRKYQDKMIPKEIIEEIVKAGTYAPTGMNKQSPIILAVTNKEIRDKLSKLNASIMGRNDIDPFYGAPVVLVVLANKDISTAIYDGSLVMGNMMNVAHSLGVGSCWIHRAKEVFNTIEGKELLSSLGINENYEGIGNCILGYVDKDYPQPAPRKDKYVYYLD